MLKTKTAHHHLYLHPPPLAESSWSYRGSAWVSEVVVEEWYRDTLVASMVRLLQYVWRWHWSKQGTKFSALGPLARKYDIWILENIQDVMEWVREFVNIRVNCMELLWPHWHVISTWLGCWCQMGDRCCTIYWSPTSLESWHRMVQSCGRECLVQYAHGFSSRY